MCSSEFWGVYGFGIALGSLSFNAQGCVLVGGDGSLLSDVQ